MKKNSQLSGFYKLSLNERIKILKDFATLNDEEVKALQTTGSLNAELADRMI
jgi:hydroxymethylglutaryl-CoA reductase